jgi:hypothetical protein
MGAAAEGSYEQEVAAVEEGEEMEREDERGVVERPDLGELDVRNGQNWHQARRPEEATAATPGRGAAHRPAKTRRIH